MEANTLIRLRKALGTWYCASRRNLPWREGDDPYQIWVSEVMLQQTRVETVIPYYQRFLERFPTIESLAQSDPDNVLKLWEGLGYYTRARNLQQAARILCREYGGRLPDDPEKIARLPGIGDYIAAAVLSIAFGRPAAVVDGNVKRVLARLFLEGSPVNAAAAKHRFVTLADQILDRNHPGQFNQAMMELGQRICSPKNPDCENCPIRTFCQAFKNQATADYPIRIQKKTTPLRKMVFALVLRENRFLILRRADQGLLGGLWELPGQVVQNQTMSGELLADLIQKQAGIRITVQDRLGSVRHAYTHFRVSADLYLCHYLNGEVGLNGHTDYNWIEPKEFGQYAFHKLIHKMRRLLDFQAETG